MSIQSEINRISGNISDSLDEVALKGVTVPAGSNSDDLPELIAQIATGTIPFGIVDGTSTATAFTATVNGITELKDGVCVMLKNGVITSAAGFTININGLGAKPVYSNMAAATAESTIFNSTYTMLFIYDSTRVSGGCWICYRGYDANSVGYQLRGSSASLAMSGALYRYRLIFTSPDGKSWIPANTTNSSDENAQKTVNTAYFNPFGEIRYYSSTTTVNSGSRPGAAYLWTQNAFPIGYSFNTTGDAPTLTSWQPVYLKCEKATDGSVRLSSTPYVQELPNAVDATNVYIFLGIAYSATSVELAPVHPVYYHDGTGIRIWTGADAATKQYVDGAVADKYTKPSGGIPKTDLASAVQTSLGKADTAYQRPYYGTDTTDISMRPLVAFARANRLAFLPADQVIIEKTTDGGTTWTSAGVSDAQKKALFATRNASGIQIPLLNGAKDTNCGVRITFTAMKYNVPSGTSETGKYNYWNSTYVSGAERYSNLRELWFWVSTNNDAMRVQVQYASGSNPNTWNTAFNDNNFRLKGWSGSDWCRWTANPTFGGSTTQTGNYWNWRITFWSQYNEGQTAFQSNTVQSIQGINGYGDNVWNMPNGMMREDHLYTWDTDMNATFPANVTATQFTGSLSGNATSATTATTAANAPTSASIDNNGLITYKNSSNTTLFTLQLPIYNGGVD